MGTTYRFSVKTVMAVCYSRAFEKGNSFVTLILSLEKIITEISSPQTTEC